MSSMLSPAYERLETGRANGLDSFGHGPGRNRRRWFNWKKFAIASVVFITVVYFFGPRDTVSGLASDSKKKWDEWRHPAADDDDFDLDLSTPSKSTDTKTHPKSFEEDTDHSISTYCPSKGSSAVKWGLMIDAGSTGSRIHVYKFNTCASEANPSYEYEVFKMLKPGLSSFEDNAVGAAESLDPLLEEALRVVPSSQRKCAPVSVKATAGLRLLGEAKSQKILDEVRHRLETKYPFPVVKGKGGIAIMDGSDEGVYAWITANYLLGTISSDSAGSKADATTYAVLDLGGASTQIVFKPSFKTDTMEPGEHKYDLDFGGKKHELYQHSYLGYGLMRARKSVHELATFMYDMREPSRSPSAKENHIGNPCLGKTMTRDVKIEDEKTGGERTVKMDGSDLGSFDACMRIVSLVVAKDSLCEMKPCSFNGVYQPSLLTTFSHGQVLLLSYFYDRVAPLLGEDSPAMNPRPGLPSGRKGKHGPSKDAKITVKTIADLAKKICAGPDSYKMNWSKSAKGSDGESLWDELDGRPEWCLDLTFMYGLLRLGYEFEDTQEIYFGKRIEGTELGWALGAGIEMVGGAGFECKA